MEMVWTCIAIAYVLTQVWVILAMNRNWRNSLEANDRNWKNNIDAHRGFLREAERSHATQAERNAIWLEELALVSPEERKILVRANFHNNYERALRDVEHYNKDKTDN